MAVRAGPAQHLGEGVVERLKRSPAPVEKAEPPCLQVATRRHAGQAADVVALERGRALWQAVEIGRRQTPPSIWGEYVSVERVKKHENGLHRPAAFPNKAAGANPWSADRLAHRPENRTRFSESSMRRFKELQRPLRV
ncbi:hypothetical protein EKH55_4039 [Sinorhizobium alkalisoli]|nr:hypothetical protein EKH55_4039 [Sinorhizobium alkalisoli]